MQDFRKLEVWRKAYDLTLAVYKASRRFPADEQFGLTSQVRRAAASIPANIAEGCGRHGNAELRHFLQIALGSANELDVHLQLAHDLGFLPELEYVPLRDGAIELQRMLASLVQRLTERHRPPSAPRRAPSDAPVD